VRDKIVNREDLKDRKERAANSGWISAVAGYAPDVSSFEVLVVFAVQKKITT